MAAFTEFLARIRFETDTSKLGAARNELKSIEQAANIPVNLDTSKSAAGLEASARAVKQNVISVNEWKQKVTELGIERDKSEDPTKIAKLNQAIASAKNEIKKLSDTSKVAFDDEPPKKQTKAIKDLGESADKAGASIKTSLAQAFAGGAVAAGFKAAIDVGSEFEAGVAELSAITGVTGAGLDDLAGRARNLATEMGGTASGNVTAFKTILSRLGPDIAKAPAALDAMSRSVATLSRATGDSAEESVDALTTSVLQFQVPLDDATKASAEMSRMMNVLAAGAKEGAAEVPQVAAAIKVAGVAASNAKVSFEETNAAIQALAAGGKVGAEAGVALRNVMGKLGEGRFLPKKAQDELKAAGVDINKLGDTSLTLTDRMRELQKVSGDAALITELFGAENAAAANILLRSVDSIDTLKEKITGTSTASEQAAVRQATFAASMERVGASVQDFAITFFSLVGPALSTMAGAAADVIGFIGESKVAVGALGAVIGTVAVFLAAGAVKQFFGSFVTGSIQSSLAILQKLVPSIVTQTTATTGAATAQRALNLAMLSGPWAVVAGLVLAAGAAYAIFAANQKDLKESTDDVKTALDDYNKATDDFVKTEQASVKVKKLADEYDRLSNSSAPEDQKELARVTKELDAATEGAASKVDEYGNAVSISTDKVRLFTDEQSRMATEMRNASWQNLLDRSADLGGKLAEATKRAEELRDVANSDVELAWYEKGFFESNDAMKDSKIARKELADVATQQQAAESALIPVIREIDRSWKGVVTTKQLMADLPGLEEKAAVRLLAIAREQNAQADARNKKQEEGNKPPPPAKKKAEEDLLALAKQKADKAAEVLETELKLQRAKAGQVFSSKDELAVIEKRNAVLTKEITDRKLLSKEKYQVNAKLAIDQGELKDIEVTAKIKLDAEKAAADLDKLLIDLSKKEIEVGIRPKSEGLKIADQEIAGVQAQLDKALAELSLAPDDKKLQASVASLRSQMLGFQNEKATLERALDKQLSDSRIGLIENETERAIAEEKKRLQESLRSAGLDGDESKLLASELETKENLKAASEKKIRDIELKALKDRAKDQLNIEKTLHAGLLAAKEALFKKVEKMSAAEVGQKKLSLDQERTAIEASLGKGEITQQEYHVKLETLALDRAEFETKLEEEKSGAVSRAAKAGLDSIGKALDDHLNKMIERALIEILFTETTEQQKTAAKEMGASQRQATNAVESASNVSTAGSSILGAWADTVKGWSSIPFVGTLLGIAQAGLMMLAFKGISSLLGFEKGGIRMGVVGEKGPEIIGPTKDFSQMATSLVLETARAVQSGISSASQGASYRGMSNTSVNVTGQLVTRGRDNVYQLRREETASKRERLVA